jgi:hypothetical protein
MILLAVIAAIVRWRVELLHVVAEEGVLELVHPWNWLACAALAAIACSRPLPGPLARRDVCFFFWIGVLAVLGAMRELDYHVLLNPDNIHHLGLNADHAVRFRIDWWADAATPVLPRLAWGLVFMIGIECLTIPLVCARVRWKRLVLGLDGFAWLFGAGCGCVAMGWAFDDVILRLYAAPPAWGKYAEEGVETLGQVLILISLVLAIRRSPHERALALLRTTAASATSITGAP